MASIRIGQGIDIHRFGDGDSVTLGGVRIACDRGLMAHSDGDVLLHALCDALLGAMALGDIGKHFPDSDERYAGIDSRQLLRHVYQLVIERGYRLGNADMTVVAEKPRLLLHIDAMRGCIAEDLKVAPARVGVKATTSETLGFTGREEGIAAFATVLLEAVEC
ncbi:MAG: 2-C-methyl-D-erythritol 2,4-cyclodiphosphate synthase [Bermanella sp.]|jgi:2-C-methyl-D-erythritol 2,4-cyclodiphosphate synthase